MGILKICHLVCLLARTYTRVGGSMLLSFTAERTLLSVVWTYGGLPLDVRSANSTIILCEQYNGRTHFSRRTRHYSQNLLCNT
jgi:hypothetical protein